MWSLGLGTVFWVLPLHRMSSGPCKDAPLNGASVCIGCNEPIVFVESDRLWVLARGDIPPERPRAKCNKTDTGKHERNESAEVAIRTRYETRKPFDNRGIYWGGQSGGQA